MTAEVIKFGEPENESERLAIQYLRGHLPDTYRLYTNLEIPRNKKKYETDIILVAPHAIYVIDVKGVYGRVEVDDNDWYPENRQPYPSPLKKYRQHVRALGGLIIDADRFRKKHLLRISIQATVLLTTEDVNIIDVSRNGDQSKDIICLGEPCIKYFQDWQNIDTELFDTKITPHTKTIDKAIRGRSKPKSGSLRFGAWEVLETLGEREGKYVEYVAQKVTIGLSRRTSRLKLYKVDPWLDTKEREHEYHLINTAFQAVDDLPIHDNILKVQDIFESDDAEGLVLVTEDTKGRSLRQVIRGKELNLSQKMGAIGDVLRALEHAHKHGVIHRNITPENILITPKNQAKLSGFDYARIENRTGTIASEISQDLEEFSIYQDFDCQKNPAQACEQSDLYAAGQVFYELLLGKTPFSSLEEVVEQSSIFSVRPSQKISGLPEGFDSWLQKLCAFDRSDRFQSAREALDQLTPLSKIKPDLANIPADTILNNQYLIIERLGKPGSFAVAYKVLHTYSNDFQVMKIATREEFIRVQQEFRALYQVLKNPHPHIVTARWPGELYEYDNTPFLLFEYVEGKDLGEYFVSNDLSLKEALEIVIQTASGLAHLHNQKIYHQDIKPSNLLITPQGVRIIDFNVAVTIEDESTITAGTRRYLPPDFKASIHTTEAERIDRDLYALGITAYECITGHYPFNAVRPIIGEECIDPRQFEGCESLSEEIVEFLYKAIAPKRNDRFASAEAFLAAINSLRSQPQTSVENLADPTQDESLEKVTTIEEVEETEIKVDLVQPETGTNQDDSQLVQPSPKSRPVVPGNEQKSIAKSVVSIENRKSFPSPSASFDLFTIPQRVYLTTPILDKPIVLDPSMAYPIPKDYVEINSEVDLMRNFEMNGTLYWISGQFLCNWTKKWLLKWQHTDLIAEIKQSPREKLASLLQPISIPEAWSDSDCLAVVVHLEQHESQPIAQLLAEVTNSDPSIWIDTPSLENLAHWLAIEVPPVAHVLEQAWQAQRPNSELNTYYQTTDKHLLLRQWLGLVEPKPGKLGAYPFPDVPSSLQAEFDGFWEREFCRTQGDILDNLDLAIQSTPERIANIAYKLFRERPDFLTSERQKALKGYITYQCYEELAKYQRPPEPPPLSLEASSTEAIQWATNQYLPLRRWETSNTNLPLEKQVCDRLAASFEEWMLKHYPELIVDSVASSWLNYNVSHHVQELCSHGPVFWVVVDGLGWLDHQELLALLTDQKQLQLERELEPRFSILPTKTEYAKWSLYSQRRPGHESWKPDAGEGFKTNSLLTDSGKRYTDHDVTKKRLQKDLQSGKQQLYCWDSDRFDKLFHDEVDWEELYTVQRPRALKAIAEDILRFVAMHPQPETLRVVIASDHGQLMGKSSQMLSVPKDLDRKGRMAIGETDHPQLAVLDKERFDLPHHISIIRGSGSFGSFSYAEDKSIVGCHGGLYPEEVVIGFSVLTRSVKRLPVIVKCFGTGHPDKSSVLKVEINNPNPISISDLKLVVNQLDELEQGIELSGTVIAKDTQTFDINIAHWPKLPPSHNENNLVLDGELRFQYQSAELGVTELDKDSKIEVKQMYSSGLQGGLDDFF